MSTVTLGIGEFGMVNQPGDVIKTHALGSCVAIILLDPPTRTIGMVHVALPESKVHPERAQKLPGYFADTAIPALITLMQKAGAAQNLKKVVVKLTGGANVMDRNNTFNIGKRNVLAIKKGLWAQRMGAVAEDVGGSISRTVTVNTNDGKVLVTSPGRDPSHI
ncbi:chemotaxis protein CheD [bacterium]|nr:chemotaxis protein CheD [bacterium]